MKSAKSKKRSRSGRRSSDTRQKLIEAARSVFAVKGLDLTRIDEITERADVGKGTFYYHFGSKERLIKAMIKDVLTELSAAVNQKCEGVTELSPLLDAVILGHMDYFSKRWEDFVLFFQGRADLTLTEGYEGIDTPFIEYIENIESLVDPVIGRRLPRTVLRRIACAIAGFLAGYYSFAVVSTDGEDVDQSMIIMREAMVASLSRFINKAADTPAGTATETEKKLSS